MRLPAVGRLCVFIVGGEPMQINPQIFREYDIRGVVNQDLTPDIVRTLGQGFGTYGPIGP